MSRIVARFTSGQPLSKRAFVATRVVAALMLAASLICGVLGLLYWSRLSWPYLVLLEAIPIVFFGALDDVRAVFRSYRQYKLDWDKDRDQP